LAKELIETPRMRK